MTVLAVSLAFLLGWLLAWKSFSLFVRKGLAPSYFQESLKKMTYDALAKTQALVDAELARRRPPA